MQKVLLDMAVSLDGFIAGANDNPAWIHNWFFDPTPQDEAIIAESLSTTGAIIVGRRTYDLADKDDAFVDNPYDVPHFVVSHSTPDKATAGTTPFTFVTDGVASAIEQARDATAPDKVIGGGANVAQQALSAGLVDEIQLHVAPVLLGDGIRLFADGAAALTKLECTRVVQSPRATHLQYQIVR